MTDPISEGHSCSPEVDERACRRERNSSGGTYEKLEEWQFAMEEKEHQFATFLEAKMEQLERMKTRTAELQKQVAVKMLELKEVESKIVEKEGDLQVLWDLFKQALVTHYYEEMMNESTAQRDALTFSAQGDDLNKSSANGDDLKWRLLEMTCSSSYSGLVNVLSYEVEGESMEYHLNRGEELDEEEVSKTLKVRKDLFILGEVDAVGDGIEGGVQLRGSSHVDLRSPQDGAASRMAKVRRILFPEDIAVTRGGEVGAQAEEGQVLEREALVSPAGPGDMADQISDSCIEAGSDEEDGDNPVLTQDLIQMLE